MRLSQDEMMAVREGQPSALASPTSMLSKVRRYASITLLMVPIGQGAQAIMLSSLHWGPVASAWWAFVIMVGPGYVIRRRWVWGRRSPSSYKREILPYWLFSFVGFCVALMVAGFLAVVATTTWIYISGSMAAYGTVEIFRFRFLDHLVFGNAEDR